MDDAPLHVLLIEDDAAIARLTSEYLQRHGVATSWERDGPSGLRAALAHRFDAVLLDILLPGQNGLDVCRALRTRSDVPILMLSALGEEADRVAGIDLGADDYLVKPFSARELLSRIRAQVRRARGVLSAPAAPVRVGGLALDPGAQRATLDGRELALTAYEFALLLALAQRPGRVLGREELLGFVRGESSEVFDRSIDVRIWSLRQKLGDDARRPQLLKTVRGRGYVLAASGD
jgi:DNA-binding response OmpR family regulator